MSANRLVTANYKDDPDLSNDANLISLTVVPGSLMPAFDRDSTSYLIEAGHEVYSIDVTATLSDANASMTIDGASALSGQALTVDLNGSGTSTVINIVVAAADGETTKTYTITVDISTDGAVAVSRAAYMPVLRVNSTNPGTGVEITSSTGHGGSTSYEQTLEQGISVTLIAPEFTGSGELRKRFSSWSGAVESAECTVTLSMDEDKTVTANYEDDPDLNFGSNTKLISLVVEQGSLDPDFDPSITGYALVLAGEVETINLTATLSDANASMTIDEVSALSGEAVTVALNEPGTPTVINIIVTSKDGQSTKTYTIAVSKEIGR
jgi:hypothetical protein